MKRWLLGTGLAGAAIACYALAGLSFYAIGLSTGWEAVLFAFTGVTMLGVGCGVAWAIGPPDEPKAVDDAALAHDKEKP